LKQLEITNVLLEPTQALHKGVYRWKHDATPLCAHRSLWHLAVPPYVSCCSMWNIHCRGGAAGAWWCHCCRSARATISSAAAFAAGASGCLHPCSSAQLGFAWGRHWLSGPAFAGAGSCRCLRLELLPLLTDCSAPALHIWGYPHVMW